MSVDGVKFQVLGASDIVDHSSRLDTAWSIETRGCKSIPTRYIRTLLQAVDLSPQDRESIQLRLVSDSGDNEALRREILACNCILDALFVYVRRKKLAPWWNWRKIRELRRVILPPNLKFKTADAGVISGLESCSIIRAELEAYFDKRIYPTKYENRDVLVVLTDSGWEESEDYHGLSSFLAANSDQRVEEVVFCPVSSATDFGILLHHDRESGSVWEGTDSTPTIDISSDLESDSDPEEPNFPFAKECHGGLICEDNISNLQCMVCCHLADSITSNSVDSQDGGLQPTVKPFQYRNVSFLNNDSDVYSILLLEFIIASKLLSVILIIDTVGHEVRYYAVVSFKLFMFHGGLYTGQNSVMNLESC